VLALGNIALGQPKINHVDPMGSFAEPETEIIWFDVPMNIFMIMEKFDASDHLIYQHKHSLKRKFAQC